MRQLLQKQVQMFVPFGADEQDVSGLLLQYRHHGWEPTQTAKDVLVDFEKSKTPGHGGRYVTIELTRVEDPNFKFKVSTVAEVSKALTKAGLQAAYEVVERAVLEI